MFKYNYKAVKADFHGLLEESDLRILASWDYPIGEIISHNWETKSIVVTAGEGVAQPMLLNLQVVDGQLSVSTVDMLILRRRIEDRLRKDKFYLHKIAKEFLQK